MKRRMPAHIIDRPIRLNTANIEQRLRKYRTLVALLVEEMDDALRQIEAERKGQS